MVERNGSSSSSSLGAIIQKSLFFLFAVTSLVFTLSWFFVLRSTGGDRPRLLDHSMLPSPKLLFAFPDDGNPQPPRSQFSTEPTNAIVEGEEGLLPMGAGGGGGGGGGGEIDALICDPVDRVATTTLKVFMYDLAPEFHFQLLGWKPSKGGSVWPNLGTQIPPHYPGGLNLQHSIEYWLTLDLLRPSRAGSAVRVFNSSQADVIFVPFFSSLSYNQYSKVSPHGKKNGNRMLQEKLVTFLTVQEEWKRSGGRDHVILAHHPNSMLVARSMLWPAMFILSDFGRYPTNIANVDKDVIAPYKHVIKTFVNDSSGFDSRPTLLYFQGAIYRKDGGFIRQELFYLLKEEKDVHFQFGNVKSNGIQEATQGMQRSKFCLNIAGDTPSSNRLFDAVASHCVPVIISDEIELPYEDVLDYSDFCYFVPTADALQKDFLIEFVRSISREEWTQKWVRLKEVEHFFEFQYPSKEGDAVQMIWQAVARKVPRFKMKLHKSQRFPHYAVPREAGIAVGAIPMPKNFQH